MRSSFATFQGYYQQREFEPIYEYDTIRETVRLIKFNPGKLPEIDIGAKPKMWKAPIPSLGVTFAALVVTTFGNGGIMNRDLSDNDYFLNNQDITDLPIGAAT